MPENVKLGDIVRKIDGKYIYDKQATQYVKNSLKEMKQDLNLWGVLVHVD